MDNSHENRIFRLENAVIDLRARLEETATKKDLQIAIAELRDKIDSQQVDTKIANLRAEMHQGFANMIKWIVGTAIALGATGLTVITFVLNNATPKAPAAAPAPIIIYAQPAPAAKP